MYLFIFIGHFGLGQKQYFQNNKCIFIFLSDILVWVKKNIFKIINVRPPLLYLADFCARSPPPTLGTSPGPWGRYVAFKFGVDHITLV